MEDAAPTAAAPSSASSPATHCPASHPLREGAALEGTFAVDSTTYPKNSSAPNFRDGRRLQGDAMGNDAAVASTASPTGNTPPKRQQAVETPRPRLEDAAEDAAPFAVAAPTAAAPSSASPATTSSAPPSSVSPATTSRAPEAVHPERGANLLAALGSAHPPSDAELLKKVLGPWVASGESNLGEVHQLDICSADPDQLSRTYQAAVSERERVWYFLSELQPKTSAGCKHKKRAVLGAGTWKSEGAAKGVTDPFDGGLIGYSQKFSFLRKLGDGGKVRTGWVLNQLHLHRAGKKIEDRVLCKIYRSNRRDGGAAPDKNCDGGGETTGPKPADDKAVPRRKRVGAPLPERAQKRLATPPAASVDRLDPPAASDATPPAPSVDRFHAPATWLHFCPQCGFDLGRCMP